MDNCIFCKIARKEIPSGLVFENENVIAFKDVNPAAPTHVLFIPKKHIESLDAITPTDSTVLADLLFQISVYAKSINLSEGGYRVVNNMGKDGGQTVFHIHFHLLAGRSMKWPPG